ncbi:TonB family protein [Phenylobacterium sp.]|uniref:TonB family protein n=1 Tax=Phenylobacterium sp. TaxID=1871053 RepID=UPI0012133623|nr:TonB family protein [Phenylobacterium sp.]THD55367.1 MAG: TonB family protein [Phenylobacterium sp.]
MLRPRSVAGPTAALLSAALLSAALPVFAQTPTPPNSYWAKTPTPAQVGQMRAAANVKLGARAVVRCHVDPAGALSGCATLTESPAGSGYGQALAALAPFYQMKPELVATEAPNGLTTLSDGAFRYDTPPAWVHKPTERDLLAVWPKSAWAKRLSGHATINCLVSLQGAVFDCVVMSETPAGENFGAAAVALTPQFLMKPGSLNGEPTVTPVNIPIAFAMQPGAGGPGDAGRLTAPAAMAWLQAPSYADMAEAYPKKARAARVAGHVTINCSFTSSGALTGCTTVGEEPKGEGFGSAAHSLARKFQAPPTLSGKSLSAANVLVPFTFDPSVLTDDKPAIGKPQWAALPTAEQTVAAFAAVTKAGVNGTVRVMMACTVQPGGSVSNCSVSREEPTGQGVGQAALSLAPDFRITTWTIEGLPTVGGAVNIPLRYEGPAKETATAAKP